MKVYIVHGSTYTPGESIDWIARVYKDEIKADEYCNFMNDEVRKVWDKCRKLYDSEHMFFKHFEKHMKIYDEDCDISYRTLKYSVSEHEVEEWL